VVVDGLRYCQQIILQIVREISQGSSGWFVGWSVGRSVGSSVEQSIPVCTSDTTSCNQLLISMSVIQSGL
jgi:hypothetical protein